MDRDAAIPAYLDRVPQLWRADDPDLLIMAAYDEAAFRRLMREGIAIGNRELQIMSPVARGRFVHFTDQ